MIRIQRVLLPLVLILAFAALTGCAKREAEIKVGEYGSLTGSTATFGTSSKNGIELFVDNLNAQGGIGGKKVHVLVEDDQGKPEEAATAVNKLIAQDGVVAVLGEVASSRSLAAAPICQSAGVPMISPSSTNPKVTEVGDYIFRMCFIDPFQGTVMAKFTAQNLGLKKVAILTDNKNAYSVGLTQFFKESFVALGGQVVTEQSYGSGDTDFRSQLTAIKAKGPQAIYLPGYYTEAGLISRQARELGIQAPILGGDGWESDQLIGIGGPALEGCYYSNHFAADNPDPRLQEFLKTYAAKYAGQEPNAIVGLAYDAGVVLFQCMEALAAKDPAAFKSLSSARAG